MLDDPDALIVSRHLPVHEQRALARSAERGDVIRLRRGVHVRAETWNAASEAEQAVLRMHALDLVSDVAPVFSHWSAALLLGLPVPHAELRVLHRIVPERAVTAQQGVTTHRLTVSDVESTVARGLRVTTLPRTAVDLAASASFDEAVTVADAALRAIGRGTDDGRAVLRAAWDAGRPRRGDVKVARVIDFADALSESPGEWRSRVTMHRLGLPAPMLQQKFFDAAGFIGRADFWFPHHRVVGEIDGKMKYFDQAMNGGDPAAVVYAEKLREDRIRALGFRVVRWRWREAVEAALLGPLLAAAGVYADTRRH